MYFFAKMRTKCYKSYIIFINLEASSFNNNLSFETLEFEAKGEPKATVTLEKKRGLPSYMNRNNRNTSYS